MGLTASDKTGLMLDALRQYHATGVGEWVYAEEVRVSVGYLNMGADQHVDRDIRRGAERTIDAFALHTWRSKGFRRIAYEVKATRADLRRELDNPDKSKAALALSNAFYLVVHDSVRFDDLEIPSDWGIRVLFAGRLVTRRPAKLRKTPEPPYTFMLSLARNLANGAH